MDFSKMDFSRFKGGFLTIKNVIENYQYRAGVASVEFVEGNKLESKQGTIKFNDLRIRLLWMDKWSEKEQKWEMVQKPQDYVVSLVIYRVREEGEGLRLTSFYTNEDARLTPKLA